MCNHLLLPAEQGPYGEAPRYPPGGQWQAQGAYSQQPAAGYPAIYQYAPPPTVRGRVHDAYPQVASRFMASHVTCQALFHYVMTFEVLECDDAQGVEWTWNVACERALKPPLET